MTRPAKVALICVTHNSERLLDDFAAAAMAGLARCDVRVVVVDSGSCDGTVARAAAVLPNAEIHELDGNRGFSAGINAGVERVRQSGGADAFLVINPDVRLEPDRVELLLERLASPGVGIAVPRLCDQFGNLFPSLHRAPSISATWSEAILGGPLAARLHLPTDVIWDHRRYGSDTTTSWATGALMAISNECLDAVGLWDESFFLYEEEVDFCLRAGDAGFATGYVAQSVATRVLLTGPVAPWAQALMRANRATLVRRRRPRYQAVLTRAGLLFGDAVRSAVGRPEAKAALWSVWHAATPAEIMARYGPQTPSA